MAIKDIRVVETIKEGVTIFPAVELKPVAAKNPRATYSWTIEACDMADVNAAAHKEWTLVMLNGEKIQAEPPPTMMFADGKVTVFGGINRLSGSYALVQGSVVMGDIASTKKAGPPELMELENKFADTLAKVNGFNVSENELKLLTDGKVVGVLQAPK